MSAEAWRRIGSDLAPLDLAWQAWHFRHLSLDLCGRCGTFGTFIDVCGSLATNWVGFGAAGSCVAGVLLSAPQARFVRRDTFSTSGSICVAGVVLSVPS